MNRGTDIGLPGWRICVGGGEETAMGVSECVALQWKGMISVDSVLISSLTLL